MFLMYRFKIYVLAFLSLVPVVSYYISTIQWVVKGDTYSDYHLALCTLDFIIMAIIYYNF